MKNEASKEKIVHLKILPFDTINFVRCRIFTIVTAVSLSFLAGRLSKHYFALVFPSIALPFRPLKRSSCNEFKESASSTAYGYHSDFMETLVHPAMLAHNNPKRILVIGGVRKDVEVTSLLTEVFRHKTVEKVTVVATMEQHFLAINRNLSDIRRKPTKRQKIEYLDSLEDFRQIVKTEPPHHGCFCEYQSPFDVVVLLHPFDLLTTIQTDQIKENLQYTVELSRNASSAIEILSQDIMSPEGVLVTHLGPSPFLYRKSIMASHYLEKNNFYGSKHLQLQMIDIMARSGEFEDVHVYEDASNSRSTFRRTPQSYAIFCKDENCRNQWYADESYFSYRIHTRLSSQPLYIDGAMLERFHRPPKAWESLYCSFNENRRECQYANGFDPEVPNIPYESFEVKTSSLGKNAGRGLFTKVDITEGCYIMLEKSVHLVRFSSKSVETILQTKDLLRQLFHDENDTEQSGLCLFGYPRGLHELEAKIDKVLTYLEGYGYDDDTVSSGGNCIDSGLSTFVNHGCKKTFNYGPLFYFFDRKAGLEESEYEYAVISEEEADPEKLLELSEDSDYAFDPLYDRHLEHMQSSYEGSIVNVSKGQELFCNYVLFSTDESWKYIQRLRSECRGEIVGTVVEVEGVQT